MSLDRREFFAFGARGIGATALLRLLREDGGPHHRPRAKSVVHICLVGGLSHLDSFDYKPGLTKHHGKPLPSKEQPDVFFGKVGLLRRNDWEFRQHGESGLWISDLFPHIATQADELTVIRSMVTESANHTPALFFANSGFEFNGYPSLGSWLSYGLGNASESLPTYVVLPDERGAPNGGASNWTAGFLPAQHQGIVFGSGPRPVRDLQPAEKLGPGEDAATRTFLRGMNQRYASERGDDLLAARLRSYELAARMQLSVPEVSELSGEPQSIRDMYGVDTPRTADCGRRCLLARRLLERGVRFVQIFSGGPIAGKPRASWDAHEDVKRNHGRHAARLDQPVAALLADLRQRGMLDDTLVLFTTEFGRTPFAQSSQNTVGPGRDHNRYGFSCWLAGAGLKSGIAYGQTDEIGWKAVEDPVPWHDFHATVLHLLGLDHERLTHYHDGIERRITNVHGRVIREILA